MWYLYNSESSVTYESLSVEKANGILRDENPEKIPLWFAWSEGMEDWQPVVAITELDFRPLEKSALKEREVQTMPAPPAHPKVEVVTSAAAAQPPTIIPSREDADGQMAFDFGDLQTAEGDLHEFVWMPESSEDTSTRSEPTERRRFPREMIRLKVVVKSENVVFSTFSRNVSLGGLALESAVPAFFEGRLCQLQLIELSSGASLSFTGQILPGRGEARFVSFFQSSPDQVVLLEKWIQLHMTLRKKSS